MDRSFDAGSLVPSLPHERATRRGPDLLAITLIVAATLLAFRAAANFDFLNWDDEPLLLQNTSYRGFGVDELRWMFTSTLGGHYQPLTWLSFASDYVLWNMRPGGFHLTNIVLHLLSAIAFYRVTSRLLRIHEPPTACAAQLPEATEFARRKEPLSHGRGSVRSPISIAFAAGVAAIVFAVHPLRVESVVWITERRDVLSGVFLLSSLAMYLRYTTTTQRRAGTFLASVACFALSLLSKASGMSFPFVLLVLDLFPLRRCKASIGRILMEKAAFGIPALVAAMFALHAQRESGALWTFTEHPLSLRIAQACYGVFFYVWKTLLPLGLSPLYEQPTDAHVFDAGNILGAVFVVAASGVAWAVRKRFPSILSAWACYLLLIAPVLGLAQSGPQLVADRYSYLSCLPWALLLAGIIAIALKQSATQRHRTRRFAVIAACVVALASLILLTQAQTRIWKNSETLWTGVLKQAPRTGLAHANLATLYNEQLRYAEAKEHAAQALTILPGNRTAHVAAATAALALDDAPTAEIHFRRALEIAERLGRADAFSAHGLAQALARTGRVEEAIGLYRSLADAAPTDAEWPLAAGTLLAQLDRFDEARIWLERAIRVRPDSPTTSLRLGVVWMKLGNPAKAVEIWQAGLQHSPGNLEILEQLARAQATTADDRVVSPGPAEGTP